MQSDMFINRYLSRNTKLSKDKKEFYHLGVIDYLQAWNFNKKGEALIKTYLKGKDKNKISAVEPDYYQKRFYDFMKNKVLLDNSENIMDMGSFKQKISTDFLSIGINGSIRIDEDTLNNNDSKDYSISK